MPEFDRAALQILKIYDRCRSWGKLPYPGGILAQPAWLMDLFDVVDALRSENLKKQEQKVSEELSRSHARKRT